MKTNDDSEYEQESMPKNNKLFTINTNYNSSEINKVMKSSTNIFTHLSPLLTETLTTFKNNNNRFKSITSNNVKSLLALRNKNSIRLIKPKSHNNYLKTHNNFHTLDDEFALGPNNFPSIKDKNNLASFYKMSGDQKISYRSPEEKIFRDKLFEKYDIKKDRYNNLQTINNLYPQKTENNAHLKISVRYFKNLNKAKKLININKQLVHRVNELTNFFLLQKYSQKIETNQMKKFYERKMPKIQIRVQTKKSKFLKDNFNFESNIYEENQEKEETEKEKKLSKKRKESQLYQDKKINSLGSIKFSYFRKFAYNGLIEPELIEDFELIEQKGGEDDEENEKKKAEKMKKLNKIERHYLSLNINKMNIAFKPNSRIDFSISKFGNKIYLYGGFSSKIYNELWTYNIDTNKWNKIKCKDKDEPIPRKGHTSLIIKNNMFIFGGESPKENVSEDIIAYNLILNKFYYPKIQKKKKINQRKGHIMIGTNQTFLIHGGMDIRTLVIENSAFIYNIAENYWEKLEYIGKPLPYRAYHCAALVNSFSKSTLSSYTFYTLPDDLSDEVKKKIRYEGIYIFGGINEKKMYCNDLYVIKTGKKPCTNIKPKISGKPPEPRIHSKMLFIENYFFVIIHGGIQSDQNFCDNIAVLNLENFNWIKPIIDDERGTEKRLIGRIKHDIFFDDEKLYIFGGLGDENMLPLNFEIVEFEVTGFFNNLVFPNSD